MKFNLQCCHTMIKWNVISYLWSYCGEMSVICDQKWNLIIIESEFSSYMCFDYNMIVIMFIYLLWSYYDHLYYNNRSFYIIYSFTIIIMIVYFMWRLWLQLWSYHDHTLFVISNLIILWTHGIYDHNYDNVMIRTWK